MSLELGAKAPAIVMDDANIELAHEAIKASRVINTAKSATALKEVHVHERIADVFIEKMAKAMATTTYGNPLADANVEMGPPVSKEALESVDAMVQRAVQNGAILVTGGKRPTKPSKGFFYEPTVLTECSQDVEIRRKEIFGQPSFR